MPPKWVTGRLTLLLLASLYFYASWRPAYLGLILVTTLTTYLAALGMERYPRWRGWLMGSAIVFNLLILFLFKYYQFFSVSLRGLLAHWQIDWSLPEFKWLLPVGISFYTFQSIGYMVDVYRRRLPAERNLAVYTLFVTFFPQLVAGPIERSWALLPQFRESHQFDYVEAVRGCQLIARGLFKKMIIADNVAPVVDYVFAHLREFQGLSLVIAVGLFAVQIWGDFSGYSDIAVGSARLLGFRLMTNFKTPYLATSITDFWRRWHISLSGWFRDYLYIPLGGNRRGRVRTCLNLFLVFVCCGLWHGASWTFVWWGIYFGVIIVAERLVMMSRGVKKLSPVGLAKVFGIIYANLLVWGGWVLFRAGTLAEAVYIYRHAWVGVSHFLSPSYWAATLDQVFQGNWLELAIVSGAVVAGVGMEMVGEFVGWPRLLARLPGWSRYLLYVGVVAVILAFHQSSVQEFIYFQF